MEIKELLSRSRAIWGQEKLSLEEIIVRLGTVFGDICRWERNARKDAANHNERELKKEMGNLIFSTIKFCDELGFDPEECISIAAASQSDSSGMLKK